MGKPGGDGVGRRLSDEIARWATASAALLATALLGVIVFFYGNMPKDIAALRESMAIVKFQVGDIQDQQKEVLLNMRASQKLSERVSVVEQRVDRQSEQINLLDKRLNRVEDRSAPHRSRP